MDKIIDKLDYLHRELAKSGIDSNTYKNLSSILIEVKSELRKDNAELVKILEECMDWEYMSLYNECLYTRIEELIIKHK